MAMGRIRFSIQLLSKGSSPASGEAVGCGPAFEAVVQLLAVEDVGVFGEEAEHQARHEMVHVAAALVRGPGWVLAYQFDVALVQAPHSEHVDGVVLDLAHGGDDRQRQQETEMVWKVWKGASDSFAAGQFFGPEGLAISGKDELGLSLRRGQAYAQRLARVAHGFSCTHCQVDVLHRSTPGTSEALLLPVRLRLSVVSLLPKEAWYMNGNFPASEGSEPAMKWLDRFVLRSWAATIQTPPCGTGALHPR